MSGADPRSQGAIFEMSCRCSGTQPVDTRNTMNRPLSSCLNMLSRYPKRHSALSEPARCAVYSIKAFHRMDQIGGLDTVCPDISELPKHPLHGIPERFSTPSRPFSRHHATKSVHFSPAPAIAYTVSLSLGDNGLSFIRECRTRPSKSL